VESVQNFFTKRLPGLLNVSYVRSLEISLEYRRILWDLTFCYKASLLANYYDTTIAMIPEKRLVRAARGNRQERYKYSFD